MTRHNEMVAHVTKNLEKFELGEAAASVYDFIWSIYCDWYIELAKPRLYNKDGGRDRAIAQYLLVSVLRNSMALLHPFMPFVTEEIWQHLPHEGETIMLTPWPVEMALGASSERASQMEIMMEAIKSIRNMRAEMNVPLGKKSEVILVPTDKKMEDVIKSHTSYFETLAWAEKVTLLAPSDPKPENATAAVVNGVEVYLLLKDLIDVDKERARIDKEQVTIQKEIARLEGKLNNEGFLAKAPEAVVAKEKEKLNDYKEKEQALIERSKFLDTLG